MARIAVVALGGNALLPAGVDASIEAQISRVAEAARSIGWLLQQGWRVIVTHGNGPQVGNILIRSEQARGAAYAIPLAVAVAQSQGEIGYLLQQALYNEFQRSGQRQAVAAVITQTVVSAADPAFTAPTKPVGPFLSEKAAGELAGQGVALVHVAHRGWRRVVPSPRPLAIVETALIEQLVDRDAVVIAAGGGGIPVLEGAHGLSGVDAVVDKDLSSAVLAEAVQAEWLVMLTDVSQAYLHYQEAGQVPLGRISVSQARQYLAAGHFPPGSMGPKIEGAIRFAAARRHPALITCPEELAQACQQASGTHVMPDSAAPGVPHGKEIS